MKLFFGLFTTLLLSVKLSQACDCIEPTMDVNYTRASHVFYGEVIDDGSNTIGKKGATIRISQWFKSSKQDPLTITLAAPESDCDFYFQVGQKWLIFANGHRLRARQCGG